MATLPIVFMPHEPIWGDFERAPQPRPEFVLGEQFVESHPERWRQLLIAARWAILPFTVMGGLVCYLWARDLFGRKAGLTALCLWCFCPNILTWSSLVCTDGAAAAMGAAAGYTFWRWLRLPTWRRAMLAGLFMGLALLSKMTWLVLFTVWPAVWTVWRGGGRSAAAAEKPGAARLAAVLLIGVYVVNLGYAFDGAMTPLGRFQFARRLFGGGGSPDGASMPALRLPLDWLRWLPVPLPAEFVRGVDLQRADFEKGLPSYLLGEWSDHGWWYYYLVGLAIKVPLGTWCLGLLTSLALLRRWWPRNRLRSTPSRQNAGAPGAFDDFAVLAPAVAVLALVSSQSGFSGHFRYALPAFPFAFVWISQSANQAGWKKPWRSAVVLGAVLWSMASSLAVFPHTMSYFNEVVGGPANGHRYMLGSSLSWSQEYFYVRRWLCGHADADSPYTLLERSISLERLGLRSRGEPPPGTAAEARRRGLSIDANGPVPGWHVVSLQRLHDPSGAYLYFERFQPVATIGYSTRVYQIELSEANRVRRTMGLPQIMGPNLSSAKLLEEMAAARSSRRPVKVALFAPAHDTRTPARERATGIIVADGAGLSSIAVTEHDLRGGCLERYDVLLIGGGQASVQGGALGTAGRAAVREFVRRGGGYVGVCAGAHLAGVNHE